MPGKPRTQEAQLLLCPVVPSVGHWLLGRIGQVPYGLTVVQSPDVWPALPIAGSALSHRIHFADIQNCRLPHRGCVSGNRPPRLVFRDFNTPFPWAVFISLLKAVVAPCRPLISSKTFLFLSAIAWFTGTGGLHDFNDFGNHAGKRLSHLRVFKMRYEAD